MGDLLAYWAVAELLGVAGVPLAALLFRRLPGRGLTLARPLALLVAAYPVWLLASLKAVPYGRGAAVCGVVLVAALSALVVLHDRRRGGSLLSFAGDDPAERSAALRLLGAGEALFALVFLAVVLLRWQVPDVWGTDKPMNLAFVNAIARSDYFPPHDPWAAGLDLNYYYFGHYLMQFAIGIVRVPTATGYNLSLALVFGMAASGVFGVASTLHLAARRGAWRGAAVAGLVAVALVLVLGNLAGTLDFLRNPVRPSAFDWRQASFVIPNTINDFPFFSLLIADLHAHVIALPFQLLALLVALQLAIAGPARGRAAVATEVALGSLALGCLYAINSWSFPPALAIAVVALGLWALRERARAALMRAAAVAVALGAGSVVAFLPFYLDFHPIVRGLGFVRTQTGMREFLSDELTIYALPAWVLGGALVWRLGRLPGRRRLWLAALPVLALLVLVAPLAVAKAVLVGAALALAVHAAVGAGISMAERFFWLLAAAGLMAATIGEFVYVRDISDGTPGFRLITVFKLGDQAWVLLGLAAAFALVSAPRWLDGRYRRAWLGGAALLAVGTALWSAIALDARLTAPESGPTLDGMRWLERSQPGDAAAIDWLRTNARGNPVVLEAIGDVGLDSRVATYTGLPGVMGWPGHEKQWNHAPGSRPRDAATIYRTRDPAQARGLLDRYRVRYVVVGSVERADYPGPGLGKFGALGTLVFQRAGTRVYRVDARVTRAGASPPLPPSARAARPG